MAEEVKSCAICTLGIASDEKFGKTLKELECHHVFHYACVMAWMAISPTCPTCRHEVEAKKKKHTKTSPLSARRKSRRLMTIHDLLGVSKDQRSVASSQRRRVAVREGTHLKRPLRLN
jgi:hypothetical protein